MAKLSSANQPGFDDIESLKRRYQRQNRELARANATQAQQIQALNTEITQYSTENLRLKAELINVRKQLDERDAQGSTPISEKAKKMLEEKLEELTGLIRGLGEGGNSGKRRLSGKRWPQAMKPDLSLRERPEGFLADIPEYNERITPATPRRPFVCLGPRVDAIIRAAEEGSPIKDYIPLDSAMFDVRPRRRRDSSSAEFLIAGRVPSSKSNADLQAGAAALSPGKRKFEPEFTHEELGEIARSPMMNRFLDFRKPVSPAEPEEVKPTFSNAAVKEVKESDTEAPAKKDTRSAASPVKLDLATASRFLSSNRKSLENFRELVNTQPTPEAAPAPAEPEPEVEIEIVPIPTPAQPAESRRALEPKSTNVHVGLSPAKLPTVADFEYVKKDKPSPRDRESVKKASRLSSKPIVLQGVENTLVEEKATGTERSRRTRGVAVNYALPALNKKLRRDTEALVDAVTGIKPKRRTSTADDGAVDDIERRTSKMSIHYDANPEMENETRNVPDRSGSRMSERELEKMMTEKVRDRETRMREARKDLYEFTATDSSSADAMEIARRASLDRNGLSVGGSHQRRTSGGLTGGISAISTTKREEDQTSSTTASSSGNVRSASDIIEERRRRRATLAATGSSSSSSSALAGETAKARKTVDFAASVTERERSSVSDRRRRSMVV